MLICTNRPDRFIRLHWPHQLGLTNQVTNQVYQLKACPDRSMWPHIVELKIRAHPSSAAINLKQKM